MPNFLGTYSPRLDDKGRLALPARFRPDLEGGLVICKGQDRCLYVFPSAGFDAFSEALRQAPVTDARARAFGRQLFGSASLETTDAQGRITVPSRLREYAGLDKDCAVVGMSSRIEIWDAAAWDSYSEDTEADFADIAEEVLPGRF